MPTDYHLEQWEEFGDISPPRGFFPIRPKIAHRVPGVPKVCNTRVTLFSNFFFARKSTFSFVDAIAGDCGNFASVICPTEKGDV